MTTEEIEALEVDPSLIGALELAGARVPYVDLEEEPYAHTKLLVGETEYTYDRSFPIKGHSAVMPAAVAELQAQGKQILVVERSERYYIYTA